GNSQLSNRPIGLLVEALLELGCKIEYQGEIGYLPVLISKMEGNVNLNQISIKGDISSQFISGLMLASPLLQGVSQFTIKLEGEIVSRPYLELTLATLHQFQIQANFVNNTITIPLPQKLDPARNPIDIEGDASAASYWL